MNDDEIHQSGFQFETNLVVKAFHDILFIEISLKFNVLPIEVIFEFQICLVLSPLNRIILIELLVNMQNTSVELLMTSIKKRYSQRNYWRNYVGVERATYGVTLRAPKNILFMKWRQQISFGGTSAKSTIWGCFSRFSWE